MRIKELFKKLPSKTASERIGTVITIVSSVCLAVSIFGYAVSHVPTSARETAYLKSEKDFISCVKEEAAKLPRSKTPYDDNAIGAYLDEQTEIFSALDKPYVAIFNKTYDWRHSRLFQQMNLATISASIQERDMYRFWRVAAYKCIVDRGSQLVVIDNIYYYKLRFIREPFVSLLILSLVAMSIGLLTSIFNKYTIQPIIRLLKWIAHGDKSNN